MQQHQSLPEQRRRLRWRSRRGLLENDLLLTRFLDRFESGLSDSQVQGLDQLLELTDNDLLDLFLDRSSQTAISPESAAILAIIRDLAPASQLTISR